MSNELDLKPDPCQPIGYQIRIKGHLDCEWTDWFEGLTVTLEDNGETLLTGPVIDQATLYGCDLLLPYVDEMAELAGLDSIPVGFWRAWADPRVDAIDLGPSS